jgi:protein O-mannosyl-transferase
MNKSVKLNIENYNSSKVSNIYLFFILLITFCSFFSIFNNEFIINWDDGAQVVNNADIKQLTFSGFHKIFSSYYVGMYQPITTLTYAFDYAIYGLSSQGFHFSNLCFHFIAVILLFVFLSKIFNNKLLIFFLTLIFAIHPTCVESIAWISARSNIIFAIFYISGLISYLKHIQGKDRKISKYYFITLAFFILSCLSKSAAMTFPFLLLLFDVYFDKMNLRKIIEKVPFILISIVFGLITIDARINAFHFIDFSAHYSSSEQFLLVFYSVFMYIKLFFIPYSNCAYYIYPEKNNNALSFEFYSSFIILFVIYVILIVILYKRKKQALLGLLFFLISLFVMLKFVATDLQLMTDRYLYMPMIGILIAIGFIIEPLFKKYQISIVIFLSVISGSFVFRTISYNEYWKNEESLFSETIIIQPDAIPCKNYLGISFRKRGDLGKALNLFNEIIEKYPNYENVYNNRGNVYKDMGNFKKAINDYNTALLYKGEDESNDAEIYTNIGVVYAMGKDFQTSMNYFDKAIEKNNRYYLAYLNRGKAYAMKGSFGNALNDLDIAISINPDFAASYYTRGMVYYSINKRNESCRDLKIAEELGYKISPIQIKNICNF